MRKLTKKKILWILRWKRQGMSTKQLAESQKISRRWVRHLWREYRTAGRIVLRHAGRKRYTLPVEDIKLILSEHPRNSGAVILEKRIQAKHHKHIPHNRIHMVLKYAGFAQDDPRKQKRRKWVRFEREHSLSLLHTDWHESKAIPGKQVIAFLDDASRFVPVIEEVDHATTENSIHALKKAINFAAAYGGVCSLLTGHDTQFVSTNPGEKPSRSPFQRVLDSAGIQHILARIHHPQTNGKMERFFRTYEEKRARFPSLEAFIVWYNTDRLHMSLKMHYAETPFEAFRRKMEPGVYAGWVKEWFV